MNTHDDHEPVVSLRDFLGEKIRQVDQKLDVLIQAASEDRVRLNQIEVAIAVLRWGYALGALVALWYIYERGQP